jgi:ubiquinone/menaquinone biosynthesis C-methylase UbiE
MDLLDVGCGPGTITIGLAKRVASGWAIGVDHDKEHIIAARDLANRYNGLNVSFQHGSALDLAFEDESFDVVFENNVFTHIAEETSRAALEIYRVLRPGGIFAARDVDAKAVIWGNASPELEELDHLFIHWHSSRGSDITFGQRLPKILRSAGFRKIKKSVSADTKGTLEAVRSHANITESLLDGPFGRFIRGEVLAGNRKVEQLKRVIWKWADHPDSFFANVHVEVIGWKSNNGGSRKDRHE